MSDAGQPEPTGTSSKKTKSRWNIGATAMVVILAGGLAIGTYFRDDIPWPIGKEDSPGVIFVGTPNIYTRERLINSRLRNQEWLKEQLELTKFNEDDKGDRSKFEYLHFRLAELLERQVRVAGGVGPGIQANSSQNGQQGDPGAGEANNVPQAPTPVTNLPTLLQYEMLRAFRHKVEHEWLKNQLDDRHDIEGNTVYQLAFDVALVMPQSREHRAKDQVAVVDVTFRRHDGDREIEQFERLWDDWLFFLEPIIQGAIDNRMRAFFPDVPQQGSAPTDQAKLIKSLEDALTDDPHVQALLTILRNEDASSPPYDSLARRNHILEFISTYRAHYRLNRLYEDTNGYIKKLEPLCNEIQNPRIEIQKDIFLNKTPRSTLDRSSVLSVLCSKLSRAKTDGISICPTTGEIELCYEFNNEFYHSNVWSLQNYLNELCSSEFGDIAKQPLSGNQLLANLRNQVCIIKQPPPEFNARILPLLSLLQARNIAWHASRNNEWQLYRDVEMTRYYPLSTVSEAYWHPADGSVESAPTYSELVKSIRAGLKEQLGREIADHSPFLSDNKEQIKEEYYRECSSPSAIKRAFSSVFLCPNAAPSARIKQIVVSAFTLNDLKKKELGEFFELDLVNCQHNSCAIQLSAPVKDNNDVVIREFHSKLFDDIEIYAYDVKGEAMRPGMRSRALSDELAFKLIVGQANIGSGEGSVGVLGREHWQGFVQNQEVVGYSFVRDLGFIDVDDEQLNPPGPEEERDSSDQSSDAEEPANPIATDGGTSNTTDTRTTGGLDRAIFGWIVSPETLADGGVRNYPVSALISVPSWWRLAKIEIGACWVTIEKASQLAEQPLRPIPDGDAGEPAAPDSRKKRLKRSCSDGSSLSWQGHIVKLPGDEFNVSHKLRIQVVDEPNLQGVGIRSDAVTSDPKQQETVVAGRPANIVLLGDRLWRNPRVFLGSQLADSVQVLPDMTGLIAKFDCVDNPNQFNANSGLVDSGADAGAFRQVNNGALQPMEGAIVTLPIRVWTSEGNTTALAVTVQPYRAHANEPPCFVPSDQRNPQRSDTQGDEEPDAERDEEDPNELNSPIGAIETRAAKAPLGLLP